MGARTRGPHNFSGWENHWSSYGHWIDWRHTWCWCGWVTADNVGMETRECWGHWGTLPQLGSCDQPPVVVPGPASSFPRSRDSRQPPASRPPLIPVSTQPRRSNTSSYFGTATISFSTSQLLKWPNNYGHPFIYLNILWLIFHLRMLCKEAWGWVSVGLRLDIDCGGAWCLAAWRHCCCSHQAAPYIYISTLISTLPWMLPSTIYTLLHHIYTISWQGSCAK